MTLISYIKNAFIPHHLDVIYRIIQQSEKKDRALIMEFYKGNVILNFVTNIAAGNFNLPSLSLLIERSANKRFKHGT